jgi:hypothetical protein
MDEFFVNNRVGKINSKNSSDSRNSVLPSSNTSMSYFKKADKNPNKGVEKKPKLNSMFDGSTMTNTYYQSHLSNNLHIDNHNKDASNKTIAQKIKDMKLNLMIKSNYNNIDSNNIKFNNLQNNAPDLYKFFKSPLISENMRTKFSQIYSNAVKSDNEGDKNYSTNINSGNKQNFNSQNVLLNNNSENKGKAYNI